MKRPGVHVALLRGINVGGKNELPMKDLAASFVDAGCDDVRTYIQSGNVVFRAQPPPRQRQHLRHIDEAKRPECCRTCARRRLERAPPPSRPVPVTGAAEQTSDYPRSGAPMPEALG